MTDKRIINNKGQIIGTWGSFDEMNDITLAYNLAVLTNEELKKVPKPYIIRWKAWQEKQSGNPYWNNPLHC